MTTNETLSGRQRLCRLCLTDKASELQPIFGGGIPDLEEKIYDCTTIEIRNIDGIPALICQLCRSKIVVCHQFITSCQKSDRKFHRMFGAQFRQHKRFKPDVVENVRLSVSSSDSESKAQDAKKVVDTGRQLALPAPAKAVVNPLNHAFMHRLKNDDKLLRYSIEDRPKVKPKVEAVKRLLSEDGHDTSIEQLAAKIEQSLTNEVDHKSEGGRRKCPKCGQLVLNLHKHLLLHSTVSRHVCEVCDKSFSQGCYLKYHMNTHTGNKPYACSDCGQSFTSPALLWNHNKIHREGPNKPDSDRHREDRRYRCNVCHSAFKHRKLMNRHMHEHHLERQHACKICGKAYYTRDYMLKHRRIHDRAQ